ncbi:AfsR/SARP family transcriptional regulator [Streptomyces tagetis]|uniref:Transcriptional regulator n=1 Tax=Streptomyces tagetis TaxID=2820809 RepID=A0A941B0E1_9ACTN|nr:BTAD domain-containing putative transcriptional regulator [Streptomyces sp. RG38]MBQ0826631.1 transcriptional regulator [Streptomyces sp. RG38]
MSGNDHHPGDVSAGPGVRLRLLPTFELSDHGGHIRLQGGAQRLLAFLAMCQRPPHRSLVATRLWADLPDERSSAALRTSLWQVRRAAPHVVVDHHSHLRLCGSVEVDVHEAARWLRLLETGERTERHLPDCLSHDLLPDWPDEWAVIERERFRQIRLHALETLCRRLTQAGEHRCAIEVGLSAVAADPLRETAQRVLIEAHIAEGNLSEAVRQYRSYSRMLHLELGVEPTVLLTALLPRAAHAHSAGRIAARR